MDRIFGLDQQTLVGIAIQLFNACLLAAALTWILYKPVRKFLRKRADAIEGQFNEAENNIAKANEIKALYEEKLVKIEAERIHILESAQKKAAEKSRQIMLETEKEIAAAKEKAAEDIASQRRRASEEMRREMIEVASLMAEKFVALSMDEDAQNRLFEEAMAEMEVAL